MNFTRRNLGSPRPNSKHWKRKAVRGKQRSYRVRKWLRNQCPHCGQPCAPFYECAARREYKRLHNAQSLAAQ